MNEIEKIASIINKRVGTDEGCVVGYKHNRKIITTVDTKVIAKYLIEAGYGDTKQIAKEILTIVGNLYDDGDERFRLKDYQWHKNLCEKYGVEVK